MGISTAIVRELMLAGLEGEALLAALERIEAASAPKSQVKVPSRRSQRDRRYYLKNRDAKIARALTRLPYDEIYARDGNVCAYCGTTKGPFQIDHIFPRSRGGSDHPDNLTVACRSCNAAKCDRTPGEWRTAQ